MTAPSEAPRYIASAPKALEVILWLASECPGIDIYHLVKACFYADKHHVTKYGRPIVGDTYEAAQWGPLPKVIYGLLRHEPFDVLAAAQNGESLPFRIDGNSVIAGRLPNLRKLSQSDIEALTAGLAEVRDKSFNDLVRQTHRDPAYRNAAPGGVMDYRDFIPESDNERDQKIEYLQESASGNMVF